MPKEYKIETIHDMMEIPIERFPIFLRELPEMLHLARITHEFNSMATKDKVKVFADPPVWIDDDKGEMRLNIIFQEKKEKADNE